MSTLGCPNCDGPCIPTCVMSKRTLQDLLGERRLLTIEASHERDKTVRGVIEFGIAEIDRELAIRRLDAAAGSASSAALPTLFRCVDCDRRYATEAELANAQDVDGCLGCGSTDLRPIDVDQSTTIPDGEHAKNMYQWHRATGRTGPRGQRPKATADVHASRRAVDVPTTTNPKKRQRIARVA